LDLNAQKKLSKEIINKAKLKKYQDKEKNTEILEKFEELVEDPTNSRESI
jgi:hypothetical protein